MLTNIRGELTSEKSTEGGYDLVGAVVRLLNLTTEKDKDDLRSVLFPAMLQSAVMTGDLKRMEEIKGYVSNIVYEFSMNPHLTTLISKCFRETSGSTTIRSKF
jgi:hypothetical protein